VSFGIYSRIKIFDSMKIDMQKIARLVASVNELVKMNLMQAFTDTPNVYVIKSILQLKDKKYMHNWCQNVLSVWKLSNAEKALTLGEDVELVVYDKETGDMLCRYSKVNGLKFS